MLPSLTPADPDQLRIVHVGDIVGKPGLRVACLATGWFRRELRADCMLCNAENVADGSGIRSNDYRRLVQAGYHGITLGDHVFNKKESVEVLGQHQNIVRPCNLPAEAVGATRMILPIRQGVSIAVLSALGRVFMKPVDCPFHAVERELTLIPPTVNIRLLDFHAEATSDKQLMGRFLDGKISAVLGTHTHIATADEQILPRGTGFHCDIGMTGPFESIIGRDIDAVLRATLTAMPMPYHVAKEDVRVSATWLDVDISSGSCQRIGRLCLKQAELEQYEASTAANPMVL